MKLALVLAGVLAAGCGGAQSSGTAAPAAPANRSSGDLEARLARVEAYIAKNAAAIEFLGLVFEQQQKQQAQEEDREPAPDAIFAVPIEENLKAGLVEGPATAPVTIVKAFDFTCPYCMRTSDVMSELVKEYGGKVRVVFKNMVVHDTAMNAHLASCGAAKQGKYLPFKKAFWEKGFGPYMESGGENKAAIEVPNLLAIGKSVGLDAKKLEADMKSPACAAFIKRDMAELDPFRVTGTPTFFVNGLFIGGGLSKEAFKEIIDDKLKVAEASGVPGGQYYAKEILGKGEPKFRSRKDPKPTR